MLRAVRGEECNHNYNRQHLGSGEGGSDVFTYLEHCCLMGSCSLTGNDSIYTLLGTNQHRRYPLPAGTFKSMIFRVSLHGWDMYGYVASLKGIPSTYLGSQATLPLVHIALLKQRW